MNSTTLRRMSAIAIITILAAMLTRAYATLQIYKVKGNVTIRSKAKTVKAERRATVAPTDLLSIPAGDAVGILDSETHRIYSSIGYGNMTVKALIEKAESHAADITRNINRKVIAAVADNAGQKKNGYEAMGMAVHETDAIAYPPVILPEDMSYLAYLLANATDPDSKHQSYISLKKHPVYTGEDDEDDGAFNFAVHNSMRQPLYFNIIPQREDDDISLFFAQNPVAMPKSETIATEYTYLPDENERGYIVIASDIDFTIDDVKRLLEAGYDPEDDYYLSILTTDNN